MQTFAVRVVVVGKPAAIPDSSQDRKLYPWALVGVK
jgi:hypothetical protein